MLRGILSSTSSALSLSVGDSVRCLFSARDRCRGFFLGSAFDVGKVSADFCGGHLFQLDSFSSILAKVSRAVLIPRRTSGGSFLPLLFFRAAELSAQNCDNLQNAPSRFPCCFCRRPIPLPIHSGEVFGGAAFSFIAHYWRGYLPPAFRVSVASLKISCVIIFSRASGAREKLTSRLSLRDNRFRARRVGVSSRFRSCLFPSNASLREKLTSVLTVIS